MLDERTVSMQRVSDEVCAAFSDIVARLGRAPKRVRVDDESLAAHLRDVLPANVSVVCGPVPEVDAYVHHRAREMGEDVPLATDDRAAPPDAVELPLLEQIASELYELNPWMTEPGATTFQIGISEGTAYSRVTDEQRETLPVAAFAFVLLFEKMVENAKQVSSAERKFKCKLRLDSGQVAVVALTGPIPAPPQQSLVLGNQ